MLDERYEYDTSATRTTRVQHEWKILILLSTQSEIIFSHLYVSYLANERLQEQKKIRSKNYLLEKPRSHDKMRLKSAPQRLKFI